MLTISSGCSNIKVIKEKLYLNKPLQNAGSNESMVKPDHVITVFVHGTKLFTDLIMKNFFYSPDGLVPASTLDKKYHLRMIADTLSAADPVHYPTSSMYVFGWNGDLSFKERSKAAIKLYSQLTHLVKLYEQEHKIKPKIRIITHSHGGNVVLNLANLKNDAQLTIDELILLACPVQKETASLIQSPIFKEIFSLYSSIDVLQVIDPQGLYGSTSNGQLFSGRQFDNQDRLIQAKIALNGRPLLHIDFILTHFLEQLSAIIEKLKTLRASIYTEYDQPIRLTLSVYTRK